MKVIPQSIMAVDMKEHISSSPEKYILENIHKLKEL